VTAASPPPPGRCAPTHSPPACRRLDLDALAVDIGEHLIDLATAQARIDRATEQASAYWERLFGDDECCSRCPA
jgi:hypothetical protein